MVSWTCDSADKPYTVFIDADKQSGHLGFQVGDSEVCHTYGVWGGILVKLNNSDIPVQIVPINNTVTSDSRFYHHFIQ